MSRWCEIFFVILISQLNLCEWTFELGKFRRSLQSSSRSLDSSGCFQNGFRVWRWRWRGAFDIWTRVASLGSESRGARVYCTRTVNSGISSTSSSSISSSTVSSVWTTSWVCACSLVSRQSKLFIRERTNNNNIVSVLSLFLLLFCTLGDLLLRACASIVVVVVFVLLLLLLPSSSSSQFGLIFDLLRAISSRELCRDVKVEQLEKQKN